MKGIILAGGSGTRLIPLTRVISKSLLPVYDKPMFYYPLSILMEAGIKDIMIISSSSDLPRFIDVLGDGSQLGISLQYEVEPSPIGIAGAFLIGETFIGQDNVALILGDNVFGHNLGPLLKKAVSRSHGATVFGFPVDDPERFGVVSFNDAGQVNSIEEKPAEPKSNYAVTGLYFYDNRVVDIAKKIKPSARGELEITDVNKAYLEMGALHVELMGKECPWFDTGTPGSLLEAAVYVRQFEEEKGVKIGCVEELSFKKGFVSRDQLITLANSQTKSGYGKYLLRVANTKE
ncbi:glucose-1-phosphate thymidylyltransferase RfbA [Peribacillus glennii]|uniref:Glucose-1-phosphate thymidylyltransferase n=1 Tax=Peribacillus glennii TaxID=2303991 RepID=A0A372L7Q9_9BACI|nr:glucose-1-phosphate thymidylyltransferase RfbA [Peribacillus glennii]RFU61294.1 glucose-1-phosphate thymidylyltransferase [Peribacillus glennii]